MTADEHPRLLLIVREWLLPGMEEACAQNESRISATCAELNGPHPYLGLARVPERKEIWWLNAFASRDEKDQVEAAYARNEPLIAKLGPLGARKEGFRNALTTTLTESRGGSALRFAGARFFVVRITRGARESEGAVFESPLGERFAMASVDSSPAAEETAVRFGPGSAILAVKPEWSFPAKAWIAADPEFWSSHRA
jgi:hypothetical protein